MTFRDKLTFTSKKNISLVCVGLDSDISKLPAHIKSAKNPQFEFNKAIIDATANLVCAYKPNTAFYEAEGAEGIRQLKMTTDYIKEKYPDIPIILDAKRADIGNTNFSYIKFIFEYLQADAVTLHWYVGREGLKPFLGLIDKCMFIYCRSSNAGAGEFQDLLISKSQTPEALAKGGTPLYQIIVEHIVKDWNYNNNCGLIFGATYPSELEIVRRMVGNMPILIPGIGAQGGDVEKTVRAGVDKYGLNAIINSSRGIIFASNGKDFTKKAREETEKLRDEINKYRIPSVSSNHTPGVYK